MHDLLLTLLNNPPLYQHVRGMLVRRPTHTLKNSLIFMSERPRKRSRKYRAKRLINSEQFWDLIFNLIRKGQNLPAISKALDVPYRTLWGWINESDENRQRYDGARKEQDEMIRLKILDYEAKNLFKYGE